MKATGWLIAFLLVPFVAILVLFQFDDGLSIGYIVADAIFVGFYYLIYMFYGPPRERTLRGWLPFKAKLRPGVEIGLLLLGAGACVYWVFVALSTYDCAVFSPGTSVLWRWMGKILQGSCDQFGPIVPSVFLLCTSAYAVYLAFTYKTRRAPNNSPKRTR